MRIQTQNVQALPRMSVDKVVHDVNLTASQADLIGWQEIYLDYYRQAVLALPSNEWDTTIPMWGGCPISWRKADFSHMAQGRILLYKGVPGITQNRYLVWVELHHLKSGAVIRVCDVHYVAKGYSKKKVTFRKLRQKMWRRGNNIVKDFIEESVLRGYPVVLLGDINRMFCNPVGNSVAGHAVYNVTPPASIDKVILIDSDDYEWHNAQLSRQGGLKYSDHKGHNVATVIKRKVKR